jgi:dTDP-4-dehydrorhamnose reductase
MLKVIPSRQNGKKSHSLPNDMASKKILILGANGRLAGSLVSSWSKNHEVTTLTRPELDVANLHSLQRLLEKKEFDILVNGTGLTNVDRCESDREEARIVNALAPDVMAHVADARGARLIHFSTDYVFDGTKRDPYTEADRPAPLGWYGKTKLAGEDVVLKEGGFHMAVRVSWIFGRAKPSFVDALIEQATKESVVEAISDKYSSPTFAEDVARWMEPFFEPSLPGGLYHACNAGSCSWQEYGAYALECAGDAGLDLKTRTILPIRLADMKQFIAPRPVFSILSSRKLAEAIGMEPRSWREALRDYIFQKYAPISSSN